MVNGLNFINFKFMKKEKRKIRTYLDGEVVQKPKDWGKSMTEPDRTYTIQQIIERTKAGNMPNVMRNVEYGEEGLIQKKSVDPLTQLEESTRRLQQRFDTLNRKKNETPNSETKGGTGEGVEPAPTE